MHSRQEREFRRQLLALLQQPKRNRFLATINSPFFLWAVSAALLTIGGSYFTSHDRCVRHADQIIDRREQISWELYDRRDNEYRSRNNLSDIKQDIPPRKALISELSGKSNFDLERELRRLEMQIDYSPEFFFKMHPESIVTRVVISSARTFLKEDLDKEKWDELLRDYYRLINTFRMLKDSFATYTENCTLATTIKYAAGMKPKVVTALEIANETDELFLAEIDRAGNALTDFLEPRRARSP